MFQYIQACRAIAALIVCIFHAGVSVSETKYFGATWIGSAVSAGGDAGVEFFFVLSGFIIAFVHWKDIGHSGRIGAYIRKRFARIYPAYWIVFISVAIGALAAPETRSFVPTDPLVLLKSLLLLPQDKAVVGGTGAPVIMVAWSMQYELTFYAIFGAAIVSKGLGKTCVAVAVASALLCAHGKCEFPVTFLGSSLMLLFAMGAIVAWACRSRRIAGESKALIALGLTGCVACMVFVTMFGRDVDVLERRLIYGAMCALLIWGLVTLEMSRPGHRSLWGLTELGSASYALYLVHVPIITLLCKLAVWAGLSGAFGASFVFALSIFAAIGCALLLYRYIEVPSLRRFGSVASRR